MPHDTDDRAIMPTVQSGEPMADTEAGVPVARDVASPDAVTGDTGVGVSSSVIEPGGAEAGLAVGGGQVAGTVDDNGGQGDGVTAVAIAENRNVPKRIRTERGAILTPFTSDDGRAAAAGRRRWELHRQRVSRRVLGEAAASFPDVKDVYDAHAALVAIQYQIAANPGGTASEARAATEAYKAVRQALGIDTGAPSARGQASAVASDGISIQIGGQAAAELVAILGARVASGSDK